MTRIVAVVSHRARVLEVGLDDETVRRSVVSVVTDRDCDGARMAATRRIPVVRIDEADNERFSDRLADHATEVEADYLVLFFSRLLRGRIIDQYRQRIVNLHPSLLPAFPGMRGVRDTVDSGARFLGTTYHFIDAAVDQGHIILQSVVPVDPTGDEGPLRRRQFEQMCRGFVQVCAWLAADRVTVAGHRTLVRDAGYDDSLFSPTLDSPAARQLVVPTS